MSVITKTQICNMALAHNGVNKRISNVETDTTREATTCNLFFERTLRSLLEMQVWSFARENSALVLATATEHVEWTYQYIYPNFVARLNFIVNPASRKPSQDGQIPYRIININQDDTNLTGVGKLILTDQGSACIDYNRSVIDPSLFTEQFAQALAYLLASQIGAPLRVDPNITQGNAALAQVFMREASNEQFDEQQEDVEAESEFVTVRN